MKKLEYVVTSRNLLGKRNYVSYRVAAVANERIFMQLYFKPGAYSLSSGHVGAFVARVVSRHAVRTAMLCEGLIEEAAA